MCLLTLDLPSFPSFFIVIRLALVAIVVFVGSIIGCSAINAVSDMQDSKMSRFCKQVPIGAGYDDVCAKYR